MVPAGTVQYTAQLYSGTLYDCTIYKYLLSPAFGTSGNNEAQRLLKVLDDEYWGVQCTDVA